MIDLSDEDDGSENDCGDEDAWGGEGCAREADGDAEEGGEHGEDDGSSTSGHRVCGEKYGRRRSCGADAVKGDVRLDGDHGDWDGGGHENGREVDREYGDLQSEIKDDHGDEGGRALRSDGCDIDDDLGSE